MLYSEPGRVVLSPLVWAQIPGTGELLSGIIFFFVLICHVHGYLKGRCSFERRGFWGCRLIWLLLTVMGRPKYGLQGMPSLMRLARMHYV